ncbi:MAG: alkaline phosphatase family protein [Chthoniobacterales bacterium]
MKRWLSLSIVLCALAPWSVLRAGNAEHVVLIVWDGLRPDSVTPENTPTLHALAQKGTFFNRHHPVYPSSTEVNGTALATGMYPQHSGIVGNREYRPLIAANENSALEKIDAIRKGDIAMKGAYLAVPTIYETLQAQGLPTMVAGTKPIAIFADRSEKRVTEAAQKSVVIFEGQSLPPDILSKLEAALGTFPKTPTYPDVGQNTWTTRVLIDELWKESVPKLSLLWLSDPDYSQHHSQPGSKEALAALKANDELLALLLAKLDAKGIRNKTDILLVSDHGFSTTDALVDFSTLLSEAGFRAYRKFLNKPEKGDILVVGNGGSVFFYVIDHDRETIPRLVNFLQRSKYSGVIFSREALPGTFPLKTAFLNSPEAPDIVLSLRWTDAANASGVRGMISMDASAISTRKPGQGMHGSLSPYDMHNTLIAAGPDFRKGLRNDLPSGNADVAPTILHILGVKPAQKMDGRVLEEALTNTTKVLKAEEKKLETENKETGWQQYLKTSSIGTTTYFDEGNGNQTSH